MVHNFANYKAQQREELSAEVSVNLLENVGLGNPGLRQAREEQNPHLQNFQQTPPKKASRKRALCTIGASSLIRLTLLQSEPRLADEVFNELIGYTCNERIRDAETELTYSRKTLKGTLPEGLPPSTQQTIFSEGEKTVIGLGNVMQDKIQTT